MQNKNYESQIAKKEATMFLFPFSIVENVIFLIDRVSLINAPLTLVNFGQNIYTHIEMTICCS